MRPPGIWGCTSGRRLLLRFVPDDPTAAPWRDHDPAGRQPSAVDRPALRAKGVWSLWGCMMILHSFFRNFAVVLVVAGFGLTLIELPINPWLSGVSYALCVAALMTWAEAKSESSRDRRTKPARVRARPASPNGRVDPPADGATPAATNIQPTSRCESGANASRRGPKKSTVSRGVGSRKTGKVDLTPRDGLPQDRGANQSSRSRSIP
jgi:hypothetical protein